MMRLNAFLACAGLLMAATPSLAQLPPGSYLQTCTSARISNGELHAQCRTMSGVMEGTSLRLPCHGSIDNINGHLRCTGAPENRVPGGSYLETCSNARVADHILYANCRRVNQTVNAASLPLPCPSHQIDNLNGNLVCR